MIVDLLDRPIAFHRVFVDITGSVTAALMLSQAIYWSKRCDGWFYKTMVEWEEETGLSRREQESARKRLRDLEIIEEKKQGVPAKTYYSLNHEVLESLLRVQTSLHKSAKLDCTKTPSQAAQKRPCNTEITTETTTENINNITPQPKVVTKNNQLDLSVFVKQPSPEIWNDFLQHRKNKRSPLTPTALRNLAKQINIACENGYSTDEVLSIIQMRGWTGFNYQWLLNDKKQNKTIHDPEEAAELEAWARGEIETDPIAAYDRRQKRLSGVINHE